MAEYKYYNSYGNENTTTTKVNMCAKKGPMSACMAVTIADQKGCKYRIKASEADRCMFFREDINRSCDSMWAQNSLDPPEGAGK
jgi:hypothetical protein